VHTAAASNLGQMLNKICLKDGIGLVNIVRSKEQADILHKIGEADAVLEADLVEHLAEIGGGCRMHQRLVPSRRMVSSCRVRSAD